MDSPTEMRQAEADARLEDHELEELYTTEAAECDHPAEMVTTYDVLDSRTNVLTSEQVCDRCGRSVN